MPNHGNYAKILQMRKTPQELLTMIEDPSFSMFDQWQVQKQALIQVRAKCYVHSLLDDDTVRKAMFEPCHNVEVLIASLLAQYGPSARLAVMPLGPLTIPYVG